MNLPKIKYCPGTLAEGYETYSPACLRRMFNNHKVSHVLPYLPAKLNEDDAAEFIENRKRISISGAQEKMSLLLDKNQLRLTQEGEQGTYILKPIPSNLKKTGQLPANEHLTMQIARQIYGIDTAECAMVFFKNGEPAYITKRFDVKDDDSKWGKEDFATLAGMTSENAGPNFKYDYSYEELGLLIKKYVPAWRVEIERYFSLVLFNYLFSNGDAHLKNFALIETPAGDYKLSPAYDLVNSRIHIDDTDLALNKGLFSDKSGSSEYKRTNRPVKEDFIEFGRRIAIPDNRVEKLLLPFIEKNTMVDSLTERSFLDKPTKRAYLLHYQTRRNRMSS